MHYYKFNIADYRKDTAHLLPLEHYIYRQLIDWYFLDETPIPTETRKILRKINTQDIELLNNVLSDFFEKHDDGYHHKRIDKELSKYQENSKKNKAIAIKREHDKRTNRAQSVHETAPNHKPLTINHKPLTKDQDNIRETSAEIVPIQKAKKVIIPFKEIISLYHEMLPTLPRVEKLTKTREGFIRQRWLEDLPDLEHWRNFFFYVQKSSFLMGNSEPQGNRRPFRADLEWVTRPSNFAKISEDKYHE